MGSINSEEIISILKTEIENYDMVSGEQEVGSVIWVGDGIATIYGIEHAMYGEIVIFENGIRGMVQDIRRDQIGCIILGKDTEIKDTGLLVVDVVRTLLIVFWSIVCTFPGDVDHKKSADSKRIMCMRRLWNLQKRKVKHKIHKRSQKRKNAVSLEQKGSSIFILLIEICLQSNKNSVTYNCKTVYNLFFQFVN